MTDGKHEYSFDEDSFTYRDPYGRETCLSLRDRISVGHCFFSGAPYLKGPRGKIPLGHLPEAEQQARGIEFFRRYLARNPDNAKKTAFDYVDSQRGFAKVALAISLLFCAPLTYAMLSDSRQQFSCSETLRSDAVPATMAVAKAKKKRKGHYVLELSFTRPDGIEVKGIDQLITEDETVIPKSVPIVYSAARPECWAITKGLQSTEPDWAKRRYIGAFAGLFGLFFALLTLTGIVWSVRRLRLPLPWSADLKRMFQI